MKKTILFFTILFSLSTTVYCQQITVNNSMGDTDVDITVFLCYEDTNSNCRALCVGNLPTAAGSNTYTVGTITANGWWSNGCVPGNPADMKSGTTPFFTGAQVSHSCEATSYSPVNCLSNVDVLRVADQNNVCYNSGSGVLTSDCFEYSSICVGGPFCVVAQVVNASWSGTTSAVLNLSH